MRSFVFITCVFFLAQSSFAQEDTSFHREIQIIEEVYVHAIGQNVFDTPNIYLIDFYIGASGKFLLLKGKGNYFISRLGDDLSVEFSILLTFKPEKLIKDCLGNLHIISSDSLYRVDESSQEIGIYEPNPISVYHGFLVNCVGETTKNLLYNFFSNSNQTITYNSIDKEVYLQKSFYKTQDSIKMIAAKDLEQQINVDQYDFGTQLQEIDIDQLYASRAKFQHAMFYKFVVSKPDYNPLFTVNNEVFIFDHYVDSLVMFSSENFTRKNSLPISYHKIKGWQKEILFDEVRQTFYTVFLFGGNLYISELSGADFSIVKSFKVHRNSYPKRMMVYDGFLYYDYKTTREDTFVKLFRQRL